MLWVGLTGGIACGKSTVSRILIARGYAVVDADELAKQAVRPGSEGHAQVVAEFGPDAVLSSGEINRKRVAEVVFADRSKLDRLEQIIHPLVRKLCAEERERLKAEGRKLAFYDVPLLFEKKMQTMFDRTVVVACTAAQQKSRLISRDGLSPSEADRRLRAQIPIDEKRAMSDEVIENMGSISDLEVAVSAYLGRLATSLLV